MQQLVDQRSIFGLIRIKIEADTALHERHDGAAKSEEQFEIELDEQAANHVLRPDAFIRIGRMVDWAIALRSVIEMPVKSFRNR